MAGLSWQSAFANPARWKTAKRAFTPYDPTVPAGSYDPSLDAAAAATQRGLQDTTQDYQTQGQRGLVDYGLGADAINTQTNRAYDALDVRANRGQENYNTNVAALTRNFQNLATSQQERQNAAGVLDGGAVLQAAAKRATNQGIQQSALDTGWQRESADINTARTQLGADSAQQLGQLGLGYQRSSDDALSTLTRAQREAGQFGIDTNAQKLFQATQAGYVAPPRPKNEFTTPGGVPYRTIKVGKQTIRVDQYGRRI